MFVYFTFSIRIRVFGGLSFMAEGRGIESPLLRLFFTVIKALIKHI
jgi:hypothetical protein